jgi:hypothetical protein
MRPDFYVAHGWLFRESPVPWAEILALTQLVSLAGLAWLAARARRRFDLALACMLALTSLLALWSTTRVDGEIYDHSVFWVSGVGAVNMALLAWCLLGPLLNRGSPSAPSLSRVAAMCGLLMLVASAAGLRELHAAIARSFAPAPDSQTAAVVAADLRSYAARQNLSRPLIRLDQDTWGIAAGVILRLQKSGVPVAVEDDWAVMFTPTFAATGREPAALTIAGKVLHVRLLDLPGDAVVVSRDPIYVHLTPLSGR